MLLAHPGDTDATATLTYLPAGGSPIIATKAVPAHARVTVVTSDQPIAVERAVYWDANGQVWAAGTNATATPLP